MIVTSVRLSDFRNYESADAALEAGVNIVRGLNAQGKTNFLEAVCFCGTGRSYRAAANREMARFGAETARARVVVRRDGGGEDTIEAALPREGARTIAVNGMPIGRLGDLYGALLTVVFSPEDLRLVKAGPAERRRFMDMELCQLDRLYYDDLRRYYQALKQRNSLLKTFREKKVDKLALDVWDGQLVAHGGRVMAARQRFIDRLNGAAAAAHKGVADGAEALAVLYRPGVRPEDFAEKLKRGAQRDVLLGATQHGAHKDDLTILINDQDARLYASQGQQRTAALALKLAEIRLIQTEKRENPVLLLDDVFSELDARRQTRLLEGIDGVQSIVTCTGAEGAPAGLKAAKWFTVSEGVIEAG